MTVEPPVPGEPRRPFGPRDPGDAWVVAPTGERYWGRFGAAGLLAIDAERGVLLQHRVSWSHFGGTWALPGGARHEHESATEGALREATEEAGVPAGSTRPRLLSVWDLGYWSYTTLVADVVAPFEPVISDPESVELAWVPVAEVADRPLHPGFAASWEKLAGLLAVRPAVVVDAANVVGSVPDGWWRDRAGAAERLLARVARLADEGISGGALGLPERTWFPDISVVLEGAARGAVFGGEDAAISRGRDIGEDAAVRGGALGGGGAPGRGSHAGGDELRGDGVFGGDGAMVPEGAARRGAPDGSGSAVGRIDVVRAAAAGDDAIAARAEALVAAGRTVTVVTSDRGLAARSEAVGARVHGAGWLRGLLAD